MGCVGPSPQPPDLDRESGRRGRPCDFSGLNEKPRPLYQETIVKKWIALPLVATLALMGISGCANPADDVAPASVSPAKPESPVADSTPKPGPTDSALKLPSSPKSEAAVGAPILTPENTSVAFVGSKVTGKHDGGFKQLKGTLELVREKLESSKISAEIDMNSIYSDNDNLTNHLKSPDFFDVAKFPTTTFVTTGIESGSHDAKAKDATHTVTGNLTLHGVTKSISFPSKIALAGDRFNLDSEFFINRKDFAINYPGKANDLIRDEVVIKLAVHVPVGSSTTHEASAK
jgi:polyisoprenoid-binding protein YceI